MSKVEIPLQAFDDFLSTKVLLLTALSIIITMGIIFFSAYQLFAYSGSFTSFIPTLFNTIVTYILENLKDYPFLNFIIEHKFITMFLSFLIHFGIAIIFYYIFFLLYSFVVSFFNKLLISFIQKKYYKDFKLKSIPLFYSIFFYFKTTTITVLLFIIMIPIFLIPGLNLFIYLPIYYFFHKTIYYDASSQINNLKEYKKIKYVNSNEIKGHTGFCFMLTFIPIVGLLIYPYYILYMGHYIMRESKELRYINDFHGRDNS
jgi:hypothetical protein